MAAFPTSSWQVGSALRREAVLQALYPIASWFAAATWRPVPWLLASFGTLTSHPTVSDFKGAFVAPARSPVIPVGSEFLEITAVRRAAADPGLTWPPSRRRIGRIKAEPGPKGLSGQIRCGKIRSHITRQCETRDRDRQRYGSHQRTRGLRKL